LDAGDGGMGFETAEMPVDIGDIGGDAAPVVFGIPGQPENDAHQFEPRIDEDPDSWLHGCPGRRREDGQPQDEAGDSRRYARASLTFLHDKRSSWQPDNRCLRKGPQFRIPDAPGPRQVS